MYILVKSYFEIDVWKEYICDFDYVFMGYIYMFILFLVMWLGVDFFRKMENEKKKYILYITYFGIVLFVGILMYI